jgi:hypothetical protein
LRLEQQKTPDKRKGHEPAPVDTEVLAQEVLSQRVGVSLIKKIEADMTEDVGIHRHKGVPYIWRLRWAVISKEQVNFTMEVWEVRPYMRNGKPTNRKPKLLKVLDHEFSEKA